ncbi:Tetratricopeptide repeat, putative [Trypanosoma equiperdum]|uniref:Uncharacterized protein n=4 Tax=Trypanozoon TaxID=39700 RepID=Q38EJ5_TRYB2|nr:hypothetical protein, conserved [Trypanosoma brucei gambiense DAL972]XP_827105.1 hypothetical protein, conserved [Trypanosoma brucei brucei TREU927]RHW70359.1 Tetratricopeptide repeat [Trypanosoma brucei equiperdum]SCU70470.1 Tetratricopeptide repeat, putative [Trypanosoma equiperdum]EAN76775.1 hypothetical protein, conserved [Trypanosoma brucei brucei TREU927]CBH14332.1 hypothetical protein, conserved [Trypanosoma brucei gambiense DAL972]|eukprot:XP_011776598.1 hypothetical protein, conserved [Trypanosoma brucei gambiense DAL972]
MRQGRVRTESTVQRFAKTPIGEGFDLWDRDYLLGAMRLFLFKAETAPPFQVGPCMDATGEILVQLEELEDAREQFSIAAEKYLITQQQQLAKIMEIKALECERGPQAALEELTAFLKKETASTNATAVPAPITRAYAYQAELLLKTATPETPELFTEAVETAKLACNHAWDRVHMGYVVLGDALKASGCPDEARKAYSEAFETNRNCITALERHIEVLKEYIAESNDDMRIEALRKELLPLLESAISLHPRPTLIREKAFLLSETLGDAAALEFLDPLICNPPPEEADAAGNVGGRTVATLLKAKAAILADGGKMQEALEVAEAALKESPSDEEAKAIVAELRESL